MKALALCEYIHKTFLDRECLQFLDCLIYSQKKVPSKGCIETSEKAIIKQNVNNESKVELNLPGLPFFPWLKLFCFFHWIRVWFTSSIEIPLCQYSSSSCDVPNLLPL